MRAPAIVHVLRETALVAATLLALLLPSCSAGDGARDGGRGDGATGDGSRSHTDLVFYGTGTTEGVERRFERPARADAARAASVLYPLDGVLMPRNVYAPHVQWEGEGAAGDVYRVRFTGAPTTLTAYVLHAGAAFRYDYPVAPDGWRTLANAAAGSEMHLAVDRWDAARDEVITGAPVRVRVARGSIAGAVYYWALGSFGGTEGRILRVRQGTDTAPRVENFMPTPPSMRSDHCAACHGLSRDGNRLAVSLDDGNWGGVVDLTADLSGANPPMLVRFPRSWFFAAFNPDASRLVVTDGAQNVLYLNGNTGAELARTGGLVGTATHPAWSPDGAQVALIAQANDSWDLRAGDLVTVPVNPGDQFGPRATLHRGADLAGAPEGGMMDAYPSYSPDSRRIAFQHGTRVRASAGGATGAIYVIAREGGSAVRLGRASAGQAFYPNFTPFVTPSDGPTSVYWLLFYSRRDYGNRQAGTRGTGRRQIWVTAVSTESTGDADPSSAPYWLPGQQVEQENASAYWAPIPCRPDGSVCSSDAQCCGGNCMLTAGSQRCAPPAETMCRREGETCSRSGDCCTPGLECAGGVCLRAPD